MTRTAAREIAVRLCFRMGMSGEGAEEVLGDFFEPLYYATLADEDKLFAEAPDEAQLAYIQTVVRGVAGHRAELDARVEKYADNWKIERISRIAVTILETAMFELLYLPEVPPAAAINEAVELAKRYEEPETVAFINGILGSFARGETVGRDAPGAPSAREGALADGAD